MSQIFSVEQYLPNIYRIPQQAHPAGAHASGMQISVLAEFSLTPPISIPIGAKYEPVPSANLGFSLSRMTVFDSAVTQEPSELMATAKLMARVSEKSGGAVMIDPKYGCLPMLIGSDGDAILLRDFIEEIDGVLDYDELQEKLPTLTFVQIASGIEFLRQLSQFNLRGIDIDDLEAQSIESDAQFQSIIGQALRDKEVARVLDADQPHR